MNQERRIRNEKATVRKLIRLYCVAHHQTPKGQLCEHCQTIFGYACDRIDSCKFGIDKPTCQNCPVHCYSKDMKEGIKNIMRYSGPRMIYKHPIDTANHFINKVIDKKKISKHPSSKTRKS